MSDQDYGVLLHDANDVLPMGLAGTPWEIIFKALRDVLKSGVGSSDSDFMRKACALYFLARGDLDAVTDRDVLNGIAAALFIPYWVENFDDPKKASAVLYNWIKYKPTRPNLTALALASGMRAFKLREIYTSTEYGLSHTFGFDLGEGYETSFFAGPNAEPGLATAQRICGALTHFFLRLKDAPTLITDVTYPSALPLGAQFYFRPDQSEIRVLQGYNFDLYDDNGELAQKIDEYAYYIPSVTRNLYGVNTEIVSPTHLIFLDTGQIRVHWGQSPASAYALFAEVGINIPDKTRGWLSVNRVDVTLPPNAVPGVLLYDAMGDPITGEGWEIFAAYNQALDRLDISDLYLAGTDPVRLRADKYMTVCQVWLSYTPPPFDDSSTYILVNETTGDIISSMAGALVITVYETGVRTESFYFTTNGRNETANTDISHADIPVYLEDGTAPSANTPYDGSSVLAFMDVTGNTKQADGESLYVSNGILRLDAPDTEEGEQWAALVEHIEPAPSNQIEFDLGLWYNDGAWQKYKPPANDTAYSGLLSQEDADAVTAFGLTITTGSSGAGPIGGIVANSPSNNNRYRFECELLNLYSDIVNNHGSGSQTFDTTNFSVVRNSSNGRPFGLILLLNQYAYQTNISAWRLRVTKYDAQYIDVLLGLRWNSTQWRTVDFDYNPPYDNYWYGGILSAEDQQRLIDFGCSITDQGSERVGTYGTIAYNGIYFAYKAVGIYSDVEGTIESQYDLSTLRINSSYGFSIHCDVKNSNSATVWKCRIYKIA